MNTTAQDATKFGLAASKRWWSDSRELAVSFGRAELEESIVSWIELNKREEIASTAPSIDFYYRLMSEAFLSMYDNEIINPVHPITDLGQNFIDEARRATGIGATSLPAPKAPELTPAQKLKQQVQQDWKTLPSAAIRKKIANDRAYREVFERISGELGSSPATTFVRIQ